MLLYDMKLRVTLFDMIESSPCLLFFPTYFLISSQKTEAYLQISQFRFLTSKRYSYFLLWKTFNRLKWSLYTCYFSLWKERFAWIEFCLFVCFCTFFFTSGTRTFHMDKIDSIFFRRPVYLFILPTNTINLITTYMYY